MRSVLLFAVTLLAWFHGVQAAGYFTIGYHALYQNSYISPQSIEYNKLTHIALAAVSTTSTGTIVPANGFAMADWQNFVNTVTAYAHGNGTKTILMFGGANANSGCPGNINSAVSSTYLSTFAQNLVSHAQSLQFDGIDLDWETCIDFTGLTNLAQKIRQLWPSVFLTFPTGISGLQIGDNDPADYLPVMQYLDAVNMMSYSPPDNWGGWDGPWHVSPLTGNTANHPYSINLALTTMLAKGIPASKIGIGMAFFGSCWGSPITKPIQNLGSNHLIATDNDMSYKNIEASYRSSMHDNWDASAQVPYLNSSSAVGPKGCTYISYDNDQSIKAKADYVKNNGLQGIIIWTVGEGILAGGSNPALTSVRNYFGRSYTPISWSAAATSTAYNAATSTAHAAATSTAHNAAVTTSNHATSTAHAAATTSAAYSATTTAAHNAATTSAAYNAVTSTAHNAAVTSTAHAAATTTAAAATTGSGTYVTVYSDGLTVGWADGSWGNVNLANTNPVHSGSRSASFIPTNWEALYFYSNPLGYINPAIHDGVEFYINGGSTGGQNILFDVTLVGSSGSNRVPGFSKLLSSVIPGGIPQNAWARGYISFSTLPAGNYDGFWWQENTGGTQGELYIDDVRIKFK